MCGYNLYGKEHQNHNYTVHENIYLYGDSVCKIQSHNPRMVVKLSYLYYIGYTTRCKLQKKNNILNIKHFKKLN